MLKERTNITLDPYLKKESAKLFTQLGLDFSTAVSLFLKQAIQEQGLPFEVKLQPNKKTIKSFNEGKKVMSGKKTTKTYSNIHEALEDIGVI
ncbi:MAG: type II toxin-antitoxin system RelB/DinJ family antitoxin [Mycoplasmoidaceae bacterium]|nr:type II toxin-antitoxin system RelB/DinJ family antitoxin [Mycoplasmoidaceae bacterium]